MSDTRKPAQPRRTAVIKEKKFVREIVERGTPAKEALVKAGWHPGSDKSAQNMVAAVMERPRVKNAIAELLEKLYPELDEQTTSRLKEMVNMPIKFTAEEPGITPTDMLKVIQYVHKVKGYGPVDKKAVAHFHTSKLGLPTEGDE